MHEIDHLEALGVLALAAEIVAFALWIAANVSMLTSVSPYEAL